MIPNIPWRLIGVIVAVLALSAFVVYFHRLQGKAALLEQAQTELADYKASVKAREEQEATDRLADSQRRAAMVLTLANVTAKLEAIRANPPKQAIKYVQLPGESCPSLRLDPEWVSAYNAASEASAVPDTR